MEFSLKAVFGLDSKGFASELKKLRGETNSFIQQWGKIAIGAGVAAFTAMAKGAVDLGSKLSDMAGQTGTSIEALQVLQSVARDAGVPIEQLNMALIKARTSASDAADGQKLYADAFKALNIDVKTFMGLPQEAKLEAVGRGLKNASDKASAYNAVTTIFGDRAGPKMIEVLDTLATRGYKEVAKSAKEAGDVMSAETIAALDKAGDAIEAFKQRATIAVGNIIVNFRSEEGLKLLGMQLLKAAGAFGGMIVDAVVEGGRMIGAVFTGAFRGASNYFNDALVDVVQGIAVLINKVLPERFEINVGNLEEFKSSGKGIGEEITAAIAATSPSTFKKEVGEFWDKRINDQKKIVEALNARDFGEDAAKLRTAGKAIEDSVKRGAVEVAAAGDHAGESIVAAAAKAADSLAAVVNTINRVGTSYDMQSTTALEGVRSRLKSQVAERTRASFGQARGVGGGGKSFEQAMLESELFNVEKELRQRAEVGKFASQFGEDAARRQFGDTATNKALQDLSKDSSRTAQAGEAANKALTAIQAGLIARGIIPRI